MLVHFIVYMPLVAVVHGKCQRDTNHHERVLLGLSRSMLVGNQMHRLGLAHLIQVPTVECPNDPRLGSSWFKQLATPSAQMVRKTLLSTDH